MGFKVFEKLSSFHFSLYYPINNFCIFFFEITNFEIAYWNPPQHSLSCGLSMFSSADLSLAGGEMRKN